MLSSGLCKPHLDERDDAHLLAYCGTNALGADFKHSTMLGRMHRLVDLLGSLQAETQKPKLRDLMLARISKNSTTPADSRLVPLRAHRHNIFFYHSVPSLALSLMHMTS